MGGEGITVVVPTWRRPVGLARALDGVARQHDPGVPWEVVVVASAADPDAHRVAASSTVPVPLRVVDEPQPGASAARNRGLAVSRPVVAFLDDDCRPEPTWLTRITAPVLSGEAEGAGGRVVADPAVPRPRWLGDALLSYLAEYDRGGETVRLPPGDWVLTANAAFQAEPVTAIGGLDTVLGPNAGRPMVDDDVDLCRRLAEAGGRLVYVPDAVVVHDLPVGRLSPRYLLRRLYNQGRSDWLLDRRQLAGAPAAGLAQAARQLSQELADIVPQGPWRPAVALHAAGAVARAAGFFRQGASALVARDPGAPGRGGGSAPGGTGTGP